MADVIPLNVFLSAVHSYGLFFHTQWQICFHHQPRNGKDVWTQPFSQLFLIVRLHGTQQAHAFEHAKTSVLLHTLPLDTEGSVSSCFISRLKQHPSGSCCWPDRKMRVTQLTHVCVCVCVCVCVFIESGWLSRGQGIPSTANADFKHLGITLDVTTISFSRFADGEFLSSEKVYQFASFSFRFYRNNHFSHQNNSVSILAATNTCDMFTFSSSAPLGIVLGRTWNGVEM